MRVASSEAHVGLHCCDVWNCRMSLKRIDLTTALRPSMLPDEVLIFVQDNVGLYEGYVSKASILTRMLISYFQEVQDTRPPKWSYLLDILSNLLRRRCCTTSELRSNRSKGY